MFDCPLEEDETNCDVDFSQYFNCSDQTHYIPIYKRCDSKKYNIQVPFINCVEVKINKEKFPKLTACRKRLGLFIRSYDPNMKCGLSFAIAAQLSL